MSASHQTPSRLCALSEWAIALLIAANLLWTSLCLGGVRAETMTVTAALTCVTALFSALRDIGATTRTQTPWPLRCLFPFLIYAIINVGFISPVRWLGAREVMLWFQTLLIFYVLLKDIRSIGPRRLIFATIAILAVAALALSAYQLGGHQTWLMLDRVQAAQYVGRATGFFGNPNTLGAFYVLLIPPALALAWRRGASAVQRVICAYIALVLLAGLVFTLSRGSIAALAIACICWPLFVREWPLARRAIAAASVAVALALAGFALWSAMPSAQERVHTLIRDQGEKSRVVLWQASLKLTADAPVFGTGAGSFNTLFEKYRPEGFLNEPQWAHNEFLNVLSDYGIVGFALLFGGIGVIVWRVRRERTAASQHDHLLILKNAPPITRALAIGLLAFAVASLVDFHMHIPALCMIVAVWSAEIIKLKFPNPPLALAEVTFPFVPKWLRHSIGATVTIAVFIFICWIFANTYRAEAARVTAREQIDSLAIKSAEKQNRPDELETLARAQSLLVVATSQNPDNAQAQADLAYALALRARLEPHNAAALGRAAETAARRAIAASSVVPEFHIRLGVALDLQNRTAEAGESFARALQLAPASPLAWYHQAYHLALKPATRHLALAAAEMCLRLDPGYADADILRVHLRQP